MDRPRLKSGTCLRRRLDLAFLPIGRRDLVICGQVFLRLHPSPTQEEIGKKTDHERDDDTQVSRKPMCRLLRPAEGPEEVPLP